MDGVAAGAYGANTGIAVVGDTVGDDLTAFPAVFDFSIEHGRSLSKWHGLCMPQIACAGRAVPMWPGDRGGDGSCDSGDGDGGGGGVILAA